HLIITASRSPANVSQDTGHESDASGETAAEDTRSLAHTPARPWPPASASTQPERRALVYRLQSNVHNEPNTMIWEVIAFPSGREVEAEADMPSSPKASKTYSAEKPGRTGYRNSEAASLNKKRLAPRLLARGRFNVKTNPQGARTITVLSGDPWESEDEAEQPQTRRLSRTSHYGHIRRASGDTATGDDAGYAHLLASAVDAPSASNSTDYLPLPPLTAGGAKLAARQPAHAATGEGSSADATAIASWTTAADVHARILITAPCYYTSPAWAAVHSLRRGRLLWERQGTWDQAIPLPEHAMVALVTNWTLPLEEPISEGEAVDDSEDQANAASGESVEHALDMADVMGSEGNEMPAVVSRALGHASLPRPMIARNAPVPVEDGAEDGVNAEDDNDADDYGIIELVSLNDGSTIKRIYHRWTGVDRHITGTLCVVRRWDDQVYVGDLLTGRRLRRLDMLLPVVKTSVGNVTLDAEADLVRNLTLGEFSATHYGYVPLKKDGEPVSSAYRMVDVTGLV
ncbi:hypothetical protein THASP1DRAFT_24340, partial [Thamnocephalis sphaerospora]